MQGFITHLYKCHGEDLIVHILTPSEKLSLYRFYGARHSIISLGAKIDFEVEIDSRAKLNRLRAITPLNVPLGLDALYFWQRFAGLLERHLEDGEIASFYFELCDRILAYLAYEEPHACLLNAYFALLEYEGRKPNIDTACALCHRPILEGIKSIDDIDEGACVGVMKGFVLGHKGCIITRGVSYARVLRALAMGSCLPLRDEEIGELYSIMEFGL